MNLPKLEPFLSASGLEDSSECERNSNSPSPVPTRLTRRTRDSTLDRHSRDESRLSTPLILLDQEGVPRHVSWTMGRESSPGGSTNSRPDSAASNASGSEFDSLPGESSIISQAHFPGSGLVSTP